MLLCCCCYATTCAIITEYYKTAGIKHTIVHFITPTPVRIAPPLRLDNSAVMDTLIFSTTPTNRVVTGSSLEASPKATPKQETASPSTIDKISDTASSPLADTLNTDHKYSPLSPSYAVDYIIAPESLAVEPVANTLRQAMLLTPAFEKCAVLNGSSPKHTTQPSAEQKKDGGKEEDEEDTKWPAHNDEEVKAQKVDKEYIFDQLPHLTASDLHNRINVRYKKTFTSNQPVSDDYDPTEGLKDSELSKNESYLVIEKPGLAKDWANLAWIQPAGHGPQNKNRWMIVKSPTPDTYHLVYAVVYGCDFTSEFFTTFGYKENCGRFYDIDLVATFQHPSDKPMFILFDRPLAIVRPLYSLDVMPGTVDKTGSEKTTVEWNSELSAVIVCSPDYLGGCRIDRKHVKPVEQASSELAVPKLPRPVPIIAPVNTHAKKIYPQGFRGFAIKAKYMAKSALKPNNMEFGAITFRLVLYSIVAAIVMWIPSLAIEWAIGRIARKSKSLQLPSDPPTMVTHLPATTPPVYKNNPDNNTDFVAGKPRCVKTVEKQAAPHNNNNITTNRGMISYNGGMWHVYDEPDTNGPRYLPVVLQV